MKISCSSWSYHRPLKGGELTQLDWVEKCASELEVDGLELGAGLFPSTDKEYLKKLKKIITEKGLTIASVSVGRVDNAVLIDLNYEEEAYDAPVADVPVAMLNRTKEITLLQMDGDITEEQLIKGLELAEKACAKINKVQVQALKDKYKEAQK